MKIDGWVNMVSNRVSGLPLIEGPIYTTRENALDRRHVDEIYIGEPIHIVHEVFKEDG